LLDRQNPEGASMTDAPKIRQLLELLYAARMRSDLKAICALFSGGAEFTILGASQRYPVSIVANGAAEIRETLALLLRISALQDYKILSMIVDSPGAAVHWRATVHSRVTARPAYTEFVDIVRVRDSLFSSYTELFAPQAPPRVSRNLHI
jgi:ketosteroid isomerase-like protein